MQDVTDDTAAMVGGDVRGGGVCRGQRRRKDRSGAAGAVVVALRAVLVGRRGRVEVDAAVVGRDVSVCWTQMGKWIIG